MTRAIYAGNNKKIREIQQLKTNWTNKIKTSQAI